MYIKRKIFSKLVDHLDKQEITMLVGPRQVGKTTLMLKLKRYLEEKGEKTLFLSLDFPEDRVHFASQIEFLKFLEFELGNQRSFVFIDEIQRLTDAGVFLKGIYDRDLAYKFIVSGSGSLELKERIHESLSGRKLIFEISPIDFEEFINYKTNYQFENSLEKFFEIKEDESEALLKEYLFFGGYPKVVSEKTTELKRAYIREIFHSYLEKDIKDLLNIEKTEKFSLLVEFLAAYIGRVINKTHLSQQLGLSLPTLDRYLWYLEKTFIIDKLRPFYTNPKKEIVKQPIYYFTDMGLRNFVYNQWAGFDDYDGFVFQNFVFNMLKRNNLDIRINFWRSKDKAEVDFILKMGRDVYPIEVKNQKLKKIPSLRGLRSFIRQYQPRYAFVVNRNLEEKIRLDKTTLLILPYYRLFQIKRFLKS